jgi:hypothetical protein
MNDRWAHTAKGRLGDSAPSLSKLPPLGEKTFQARGDYCGPPHSLRGVKDTSAHFMGAPPPPPPRSPLARPAHLHAPPHQMLLLIPRSHLTEIPLQFYSMCLRF